MQLLQQNFKHGLVKLKITDPEDLWYLSHIIDPGDFITSKTTRKIKIGDGDNAKLVKKTLSLKIEAETIEFGATEDSLRINGKIVGGPDFLPVGNYHAISLEIDSEFTLEKVHWLGYQKQKLKESQQRKVTLLICLCDREEAIMALTKQKGFEILTHLKGDVPKKDQITEVKKDFQLEIIKALKSYLERHQFQNIILASPAFYKEDILKKITDTNLKSKITLATCSDVSKAGLEEVMKRPELKTVLQESRNRQEKLLVDQLLQEINKNNLAAYGWEEVQQAVYAGAVSKLLLTDGFIHKFRMEDSYQELDEVMKQIDNLKGEIHIISSDNESGKQLDGLGGIAAILRYKLS